MNNKIELLAPVGSWEALVAAVQNGANAVYLGGKSFSARHYASNFNNEELEAAVKYAHLRNVYVYVTVNTLIHENELNDALNYIRYLYEIDVDGLIVQDLGLADLIYKILPDFEIHASTQMTIHNLPGVLYLEKMGFKRVVLARETPVDEISFIHSNSSVELEAFIHGALCISYSGQCLMSSMLGGRSGNRGRCAQPCRLPYSIYNKNYKLLGKEWDNKYLLSTKDLNTTNYISDLIDSGIISLKIEGRMKRPEYVATILKSYRKILDDKGSYTIEDSKDIEEIFNRGFTKGLTFGDFGKDFISIDKPGNRAETSEELLEKARASYSEEKKKFEIDMEVNIEIGKRASLVVKIDNKIIEIESNNKVEKARNISLNKARVVEQLSKLNDSVYYLKNIDVSLDDHAFLSIKDINALRRDAIKEIDNVRKNFNNRVNIDKEKLYYKLDTYINYKNKVSKNNLVSVYIDNEDQFKYLDLSKLDRLYLGFTNIKNIYKEIKDSKKEVVISTSRVLYREDLNNLRDNINKIIEDIDGISASNLGTIQFIKDNWDTKIYGDLGLNVYNSQTINKLQADGLESLLLSPELNLKQLKNISYNGKIQYEAIGYGYLPLMIMKYCPMSLVKKCKDDSQCINCQFKTGYKLQDRMNKYFNMERKNGFTEIYNSVPISALDFLHNIYNSNIDIIRLNFTNEMESIGEIQDIYYNYAKGKIDKEYITEYMYKHKLNNDITKGHYYRGVE